MALRYSRFMRSFFDVDLIAQQELLHSTPCRLEEGKTRSSGRRFSKCIRIRPNIGFNILVMYKHRYPHPENWTKLGYSSEWLVVTVHEIRNGCAAVALCDSAVPYVEQEGRGDRKVMISAEVFITSPDESKTCIEKGSTGSATNSENTMNSSNGSLIPTGASEQSSNACEQDSIGPYSLTTKPYYGLVVRFYRAQAPEHSVKDQLLDEFQLFCFNHDSYVNVHREVVEDPVALEILNQRQQQLVSRSRVAINILSRSRVDVVQIPRRTIELPLPDERKDELEKTGILVTESAKQQTEQGH